MGKKPEEATVPGYYIEGQPDVQATQPVSAPTHPHAKYEYLYGEMRRCHLCGTEEEHLSNDAPQIWFKTLEDKARHIMECHREYPIEVQRAKEILGISELWLEKGAIQEAKERRTEPQLPPSTQQPFVEQETKKTKAKQRSWFRRHPIYTILLMLVIAYCLMVIYRYLQGYHF
jgi:hypothetical protein